MSLFRDFVSGAFVRRIPLMIAFSVHMLDAFRSKQIAAGRWGFRSGPALMATFASDIKTSAYLLFIVPDASGVLSGNDHDDCSRSPVFQQTLWRCSDERNNVQRHVPASTLLGQPKIPPRLQVGGRK